MQKLYKILWSLAVLLIIVTIVIFSFGFIIVAVTAVSLFGIYRAYFRKRHSREFKARPYINGEIIDLHAEVIHETIQSKKPDEIKD